MEFAGTFLAIFIAIMAAYLVFDNNHGSPDIKWSICEGHGAVARIVNDDSTDPRSASVITCADGARYRLTSRRIAGVR